MAMPKLQKESEIKEEPDFHRMLLESSYDDEMNILELDHVVKAMIEAGYDINTPNNLGLTILHKAIIEWKSVKFIKLLLDNGANREAEAFNGWRPIHFAARFTNNDALLFLVIEAKVNLLARTNKGSTILHFIFRNKNLDGFRMICVNLSKDQMIGLINNKTDINDTYLDLETYENDTFESKFQNCKIWQTNNKKKFLISGFIRRITSCNCTPLIFAVLEQEEAIAELIMSLECKPTAFVEFHISLLLGNARLALSILRRIDNWRCSADFIATDEIIGVPALQIYSNFVERFDNYYPLLVNKFLNYGYNLKKSYNGNPFILPFIYNLLNTTTYFEDESERFFEFLVTIAVHEKVDLNQHVHESFHEGSSPIPSVLFSHTCLGSRKRYCPKDSRVILRKLLNELITGDIKSQSQEIKLAHFNGYYYHYGDAWMLKLLYKLGIKFPSNFRSVIKICSEQNYVRILPGSSPNVISLEMVNVEFHGFCSWFEKENHSVKSLQQLARIAIRKIKNIDFHAMTSNGAMPHSIKNYIFMKNELEF